MWKYTGNGGIGEYGILTTVDLAIIAVFAALLLLYKVVRDW